LEGKKDDERPRFKNEVRKMLSRFKFLRNGTNWRPNSVSHAIKYANPVLLGGFARIQLLPMARQRDGCHTLDVSKHTTSQL
jgi:hypothetical protein